ncbi:MAG: hypothetical protein MI702_08950 [Chlorobiales bacterium]|nr:hypothetical protein [Chlorobiales bacterium]
MGRNAIQAIGYVLLGMVLMGMMFGGTIAEVVAMAEKDMGGKSVAQ